MTEKKTDVICVGQAVLDCITRGQDQTVEGDPRKKPVTVAESIHLATGGDAVNESFVLAGMGVNTQLVCVLGKDLAGDILYEEARRHNVNTDRITRSDQLHTPVANLMVGKDGSRYSINSKATILPGYTPDSAAVKGARIVSFASLFRAPLDQADVIKRLIRSAHEDGALICADTKLPTFRETSLEDLKEILPLIDYIFPNEKEAGYYTVESSFEKMADRLLSFGIRHVVIKAGAEGCYAASGKERFLVPARKVPVVDTTGAGDNFVAGFLAALLEEKSFRDCCIRGTEQAAKSIQNIGATQNPYNK